MKEFQFEGKWRKFVVEGMPSSEEILQDIVNDLESKLGVLVLPADYNPNKNKVVIYTQSRPGDKKPYGDMAQRITVSYDDEGEIELNAIIGYSRSMDRIGKPYNRTRMAGQGIWMPSGGELVTINDLKYYVKQLQLGHGEEAQAQADFYKDRQPD